MSEQKLEALTRASEPSPKTDKPASEPGKPADLSAADKKLSSLLGGDNQ
jgi:hypothetical protein